MIIRDPIHNYISVSQLERSLIDDPLFQRLRYVSQNGLAHLVYPSNRTSRFLHSLGAMHLSGKFVLHGLANAAAADLKKFWSVAIEPFFAQARDAISADQERITRYLGETNDPFYRESGFDPSGATDTNKIILLQAVRLAAVMHDLGHLPFSHTVEHVLADVYRSAPQRRSESRRHFDSVVERLLHQHGDGAPDPALHEAIGKALMRSIFIRFEGDRREFAQFCFYVAKEIAKGGPGGPLGIVRCLHSIVSGALDADRCDYVRRDGYASGFEFGDFDLQRILSTLRFRTDHGSGELSLMPTTVSTSALESFFLERYRIYRWLAFHPMVLRADLALTRALAILLEIYFRELEDPVKEAEDVLAVLKASEFERLWISLDKEESYPRYGLCDEAWLLGILRRIQERMAIFVGPLPLKLVALKAYLNLVCDREKRYLQPLWKRQENYRTFAEVVTAWLDGRGTIPDVLRGLPNEQAVVRCNRLLEVVLQPEIEKKGRVTAMRDFEDGIQRSLAKKGWQGGIVSDLLRFNPYETVEVLDAKSADRVEKLEDLSTIVDSLRKMWQREMRFRPFYFSRREEEPGRYVLEVAKPENAPTVEMFGEAVGETLLLHGT